MARHARGTHVTCWICIATLVPHCSPFVINGLHGNYPSQIRNNGFYGEEYSEFGRIENFTWVQAKNWADPRAGQTSGTASGSALKSMRQRLYSAAGPDG